MEKPKVVVIVGPTASGKSALAIEIAKKFDGEVVSADSRQVYKGMDIGTGKVTKKEMDGVPHHLLDIASPKRVYTVADFKKDAEKAIKKILTKNKLPIICGGTGFYIENLLSENSLPEVPPNPALRAKLEKLTVEELYKRLYKKDRSRALAIDKHNKVRLIRALEIIEELGRVPKNKKSAGKYDALFLGINIPEKDLKEKIHTRLLSRIKDGMIHEVEDLHRRGLSWKRMDMLGLEYRFVTRYLLGRMRKDEMTSLLEKEIWHYAKRQMTWFKKNKEIAWIKPKDPSTLTLVKKFLR